MNTPNSPRNDPPNREIAPAQSPDGWGPDVIQAASEPAEQSTGSTQPPDGPESADPDTEYPYPATGEELMALASYWTRIILDPRYCGVPTTQERRFAEQRLGLIADRLGPDAVFSAMDEAAPWVDVKPSDLDALRRLVVEALGDRGAPHTEWEACYTSFLRQFLDAFDE